MNKYYFAIYSFTNPPLNKFAYTLNPYEFNVYLHEEVELAFDDSIVSECNCKNDGEFRDYIKRKYNIGVDLYEDRLVTLDIKCPRTMYVQRQQRLDEYDYYVNALIFRRDVMSVLDKLVPTVKLFNISEEQKQVIHKFIRIAMFYVNLVAALVDVDVIGDLEYSYSLLNMTRGLGNEIDLSTVADKNIVEVIDLEQQYYNTELLHLYWST